MRILNGDPKLILTGIYILERDEDLKFPGMVEYCVLLL